MSNISIEKKNYEEEIRNAGPLMKNETGSMMNVPGPVQQIKKQGSLLRSRNDMYGRYSRSIIPLKKEEEERAALIERLQKKKREQIAEGAPDEEKLPEFGTRYYEGKCQRKRNKALNNPKSRLYKKQRDKEAYEAGLAKSDQRARAFNLMIHSEELSDVREGVSASEYEDVARFATGESELEKKQEIRRLVSDYKAGSSEAPEEQSEEEKKEGAQKRNLVLHKISNQILSWDLGQINLSSDRQIMANYAAFVRMGREAEACSRLMHRNPEYWNSLPREARDSLGLRLGQMMLIARYVYKRAEIVRDPWYSTHYNYEIPLFPLRKENSDKMKLSHNLRVSFYLAKQIREYGLVKNLQMEGGAELNAPTEETRQMVISAQKMAYKPLETPSYFFGLDRKKKEEEQKKLEKKEEYRQKLREATERVEKSRTKKQWEEFYHPKDQEEKIFSYEDLKNLGSKEAEERRVYSQTHDDSRLKEERFKDPVRKDLSERINKEIPYLGNGSFSNEARDMKPISGLYLGRTINDIERKGGLAGNFTNDEVISMYKKLLGNKAPGYDPRNPEMVERVAKDFDEGIVTYKKMLLKQYRTLARRYGTILSQINPEDALALLDDNYRICIKSDQDGNQIVADAKQYFDENDPEDVELKHLNAYFGAVNSYLTLYGMLRREGKSEYQASMPIFVEYYNRMKEHEKYIQGPKLSGEEADSYRREATQRIGSGKNAHALNLEQELQQRFQQKEN